MINNNTITFLEAFHVLATHPEALRTSSWANTQYDIFSPHVTRFLQNLSSGNPHFEKSFSEEELFAFFGHDSDELPEGQSARQAHAEEFILALPDGYDSLVGENAVRLSGGQRQRLALARAFLKNSPILILDEATSALDSESEEKIQQALQTIARDRTLLIIAHRFATIRMANHILLFEKGQIRSQSDFPAMMQDALFKRLYEVQAGGTPT